MPPHARNALAGGLLAAAALAAAGVPEWCLVAGAAALYANAVTLLALVRPARRQPPAPAWAAPAFGPRPLDRPLPLPRTVLLPARDTGGRVISVSVIPPKGP